ncbi:MAG: metal-binding protein [Lachnospiraceae bacterium]|nr:metal-binding protein [Lachnospiraceae bacterium]
MDNSERFFCNKDCRYFPCHNGVSEDEFNCLFCYCPLYSMGSDCGGDYVMKNGVKSCIGCVRPHIAGNFDEINDALRKHQTGRIRSLESNAHDLVKSDSNKL